MKKVIVFLLSFQLLCCNVENRKKTDSKLERFNSSLVSHFPPKKNTKKFINETFFYPRNDSGYVMSDRMRNAGVYLRRTYRYDDNFKKVLDTLNYIGVVKYSESDCFTRGKIMDKSVVSCRKSKYPIPIFYPEFNQFENDNLILPNDFITYIIDSKPGVFIDKDYLINTESQYRSWQHGYSKGLSVSQKENIIIFWLELW